MSLFNQVKNIIGISTNDYDEIIIIFSLIIILFIIKSLFSFFYSIFKG